MAREIANNMSPKPILSTNLPYDFACFFQPRVTTALRLQLNSAKTLLLVLDEIDRLSWLQRMACRALLPAGQIWRLERLRLTEFMWLVTPLFSVISGRCFKILPE
jgi:hypothetical protein